MSVALPIPRRCRSGAHQDVGDVDGERLVRHGAGEAHDHVVVLERDQGRRRARDRGAQAGRVGGVGPPVGAVEGEDPVEVRVRVGVVVTTTAGLSVVTSDAPKTGRYTRPPMSERISTILPERYDPAPVESKWQVAWERNVRSTRSRSHATARRPSCPPSPKAYVLEMLPYPSGEIHMGHVKNYTMGDVVAHHRRRQGAVGVPPDGLRRVRPARRERGHPHRRAAGGGHRAQHRPHPRAAHAGSGFSIDWDTEIATSDPEYYRWTQWLFLRFFEHGLAERREAAVNWCPVDQTVLANEQVIDGALRALRHRGRAAPADRSGSCASPTTPSACWTTWTSWSTGPSACSPCSATGSAGPRAPA